MELPESTSGPRENSDDLVLMEVIIDPADAEGSNCSTENLDEVENREETSCAPPRSFDYVELPLGVPLSGGEGSLQRLWEGGLFEMGEHADVTLQTACCPWRTFGANMERSGFGTSWGQGGIFLLLVIGALSFYIIFACTGSPWYIYGTLSLIFMVAIYAGHYRARIRRRFNIVGSEGDDTVSTIDDHLYHLMCGCCSLCQEARTLKSNNVHNGVWHGRGDIMVIGSQVVFSRIVQICPSLVTGGSLLEETGTKIRRTCTRKQCGACMDLTINTSANLAVDKTLKKACLLFTF